ncbi:hypothetical protein BC831DRAFT_479738 [Entophlyctis helioformis]|nr:hypothetical protein BC831DRAFT_479738 [Entophlyctis helioformis]
MTATRTTTTTAGPGSVQAQVPGRRHSRRGSRSYSRRAWSLPLVLAALLVLLAAGPGLVAGAPGDSTAAQSPTAAPAPSPTSAAPPAPPTASPSPPSPPSPSPQPPPRSPDPPAPSPSPPAPSPPPRPSAEPSAEPSRGPAPSPTQPAPPAQPTDRAPAPSASVSGSPAASAAASPSPSDAAAGQQQDAGSGGISPQARVAIIVVVVMVALAALAIYVFRKFTLRPSNKFAERLRSIRRATISRDRRDHEPASDAAGNHELESNPFRSARNRAATASTAATAAVTADLHNSVPAANGMQEASGTLNSNASSHTAKPVPTGSNGVYVLVPSAEVGSGSVTGSAVASYTGAPLAPPGAPIGLVSVAGPPVAMASGVPGQSAGQDDWQSYHYQHPQYVPYNEVVRLSHYDYQTDAGGSAVGYQYGAQPVLPQTQLLQQQVQPMHLDANGHMYAVPLGAPIPYGYEAVYSDPRDSAGRHPPLARTGSYQSLTSMNNGHRY